MNIKITRNLVDDIVRNLEKSHPFAYERVGFVYAKIGKGNGPDHATIIIPYEFQNVDDEDYIEDNALGAKINSHAIRKAIQRVLDEKENCFHVHLHPFCGKPQLSRIDLMGIPPIIPSFQAANPDGYHGIILFSADSAIAYVWCPGSDKPVLASKICIVGKPMKIII